MKQTSESSPSVQAHVAIRIDGLAAILPLYPILICLICKTAVRPGKGIENHFRYTHRLKGQILRAVNVQHVEWTLQDPLHMSPRDKERQLIPDHIVPPQARHSWSPAKVEHGYKSHPELRTSTERQCEEVCLQT
ncbi:hypothetical protein IWW34DRAFT_637998 [Fusarium oxysporum f. sp. albedinis]|nr:hypothetical protein IWW34DRAFT_637998 [Fusarium oxysporum f. sp. albedinis]